MKIATDGGEQLPSADAMATDAADEEPRDEGQGCAGGQGACVSGEAAHDEDMAMIAWPEEGSAASSSGG